MMQQYQEIKAECRDAILFFRLGDFYEMFGQDAIEASKILDITLTSRNKSDPNGHPMCGVPYHAVEGYIAKLIKSGKKVAICEQISDPELPGIVKRKIVKIITPGTTYLPQTLNQKSNRFVLAVFPQKDYFGIAFCDLSTGEFKATEFSGKDELKMELLKIDPSEIILHTEHYDEPQVRALLAELTEATLSPIEFYEEPYQMLARHFKVTTLDGFGIGNKPFAVQAGGLLLKYLLDTQKDELRHVDRITSYNREQVMALDEATIRNLELFTTLRDENEEHTLLKILDETLTSMGGRLLKRWLTEPLLKKTEIEERHEAVFELTQNNDLRHALLEQLKGLNDLERLLGRLSGNTGTARDLIGLADSLERIPEIKNLLKEAQSNLLNDLQNALTELADLSTEIKKAILDEPASKLTEGNIIKPGYSQELDELHSLMHSAKSALKAIETEESKKTGISSLKVSFNRVFGYYIEVSKINLHKVPETYIRRQTLANAERFVTPELKDYEEKVLSAEEKSKDLEYRLFLELRGRVLTEIRAIKQNAGILAEIDVLMSFALVAIKRNYVKPELTLEPILEIRGGRHPVVESMTFEKSFIANDALFLKDQAEIKLITGPNMSGKSTYLRQVALIVLMCQIGSFVPADQATMRVFDRIFTRVGASDNLVRGQSTFMVEMQESAYILNHATDKSLIILDELGRGTSTYDGLSLAWAIFEHLHDKTRAFSLFATHYHELIELAERLPRAKNYCIDVKETPRGVIFLHQIREGGIDKSYGIEVAKLAGIPIQIIDRATLLLGTLEKEKSINPIKIPENQLDIFARARHPALERLKQIDINKLTPLEALNALSELKRNAF